MKVLTRTAAVVCTLGFFLAFGFEGLPPNWYISTWGIIAAFLLFVGGNTKQFYQEPKQFVIDQKLALAGSLLVVVGFLAYSLKVPISEVVQTVGSISAIVVGGILSWIGHWMTQPHG